jgi:hypothetical protein
MQGIFMVNLAKKIPLIIFIFLSIGCAKKDNSSYPIRPTPTRTNIETINHDSVNHDSGFQFKVYAGPIVTDDEYSRMTPRQRKKAELHESHSDDKKTKKSTLSKSKKTDKNKTQKELRVAKWEKTYKTKESAIAAAKDVILYNLKDPDSARFRGLEVVGRNAVIGYVNAKNSYGGYVGFSLFIVESETDFIIKKNY